MKQLLIYIILCALVISDCSPKTVQQFIPDNTEVDEYILPYYLRFVELMEDNNIEVDYSKIDDIQVIPLEKMTNGLYYPATKDIIINYYFQIPDGYTREFKEDFILYILAHEIAHSQGLEHSKDAASLMYFSDKYSLGLLTTIGVEELILNTYRNLNNPTS